METARVIEHEGFQLVLLPRSVHLDSAEVTVELDHGKVILTPRPAASSETLADAARFMRDNFPQGADFSSFPSCTWECRCQRSCTSPDNAPP